MKHLPFCPKVPDGTTQIIHPQKDEDLIFPAALLACGDLVAFPTETVYGLGADATNPEAVAKIFKAKGRPSDNPLIVHVAAKSDIDALVLEVTPLARCLMDAFMPGPITLVMKKSKRIPDLVSAGLPTVGIRMPSHPVARTLIRLSGVCVAAPSANLSGSPSPTRAEHVAKDLNGRIPCIVDGGPCEVGLESTVVDVTGCRPVILRPGAVSSKMIMDACREAGIDVPDETILTHEQAEDNETPRAPGMKYRHYAPRAAVFIVMPQDGANTNERSDGFCTETSKALADEDKQIIGIFCGQEESDLLKSKLDPISLSRLRFYIFGTNTDIDAAARGLFDGIRSLDSEGAALILASGFIGNGLEKAYMNRLTKAAGEKKELDPINAALAGEAALAGVEGGKIIITKKVLFVCTGNTCRSPMAEAIFNTLASSRGPYAAISEPVGTINKPAGAIGRVKSEVQLLGSSAGIYADNGSPAAANAREAVRLLCGADLSRHLSRKITLEIITENDLVLTVTREHAAILRRCFPDYKAKIYSFSEYYADKMSPEGVNSMHLDDVPDPFGRNISVYSKTAQYLYDAIGVLWKGILSDLGLESTT